MAKLNSRLNTPEKRARIGERIKVASTQAGLSLKELAASTGTTPTLIYQYVRGIISPPQELIEKIAAVTRVHTDFFDPDKEARSALALRADQPTPPGSSVSEQAAEPGTLARIKSEMEHLQQLREAYLYPKRNRPAYISTLEQMLGLARTIDNRRQEAWIHWQLGKIKIEDNAYDEARSLMQKARTMFQEEGMAEYHQMVALDLVVVYEATGHLEEAKQCLESLTDVENTDVKWRILVSLGGLYYRMHNNEAALRCFCQAAEHIEAMDSETREKDCMIALTTNIAAIARATGHQAEAVILWSQCLQQATDQRLADHFLEALMNIAETLKDMGNLAEARQRLELAVVLAGFLFDDEARLSVARARLAELLVSAGQIEEARDNARTSMKMALSVRSPKPTILSALALGETYLASGQWRDTLDYAQEALDEARRTRRTAEVARARELRARAYLVGCKEKLAVSDAVQASEALNHAFAEAASSLDNAIRADAVREILAARITLARCHMLNGQDAQAEDESRAATDLCDSGAITLPRLMGAEAETLPELLKSPEIDLAAIFSSRKVDIPSMEWQAHYLHGTLLTRRLGPGAGFDSYLHAATIVANTVALIAPADVNRFNHRHPEVRDLFDKLDASAINDTSRAAVQELRKAVPTLIASQSSQPAIGAS